MAAFWMAAFWWLPSGKWIGEGAKVTRCIVADNVEVAPGAVYGSADSESIELVAKKYAE